MATRKMHALVQVHLTTANQLEIRIAYLELLGSRENDRIWAVFLVFLPFYCVFIQNSCDQFVNKLQNNGKPQKIY